MNDYGTQGAAGPGASAPRTLYTLRVVAELAHVAPTQVRRYERLGLVAPVRREGGAALYGDEELARLRKIQRLVRDLGLNLAGVEVALRLTERMQAMRREYEDERAALRQKGWLE
jgi:MerR family transcriptional regulator/heat shock protein HspR